MIKGYIEKILTISSVFFDSIFENEHLVGTSKGRILRVILNLVYAALISIPLGFITQIMFLIIMSSLSGFEVARDINLLTIPLFLFVNLLGIVLLNYEDQSFSLPKSVLNIYIVFDLIKPVKDIWKTLIFFFIITMALILTLLWSLAPFEIPIQYLEEIVFILFIMSLFISMILYSEATKDEIIRKKRQFIFSVFAFLVFLLLNIYQMIAYINIEPSNEATMFIAVTVLGLLLSMVTATDKTRSLYEAVVQQKKEEIYEKWTDLNEKYSYRVGLKIVDEKKSEISETLNLIKTKWNTGNRNERNKIIKFASILILLESFIVFCMFNRRKIEQYANAFFTDIKILLLKLFNGDEEKATLVVGVIIVIAIITWLMNDAKKKFRYSNTIYKLQLATKIELALIFLLACINSLISGWSMFIIQYLVFPLMIIFLATIIVGSIYLKFIEVKEKKTKEKHNKEIK